MQTRKYIIIRKENGQELGFTFDESITHADFYDGAIQIPFGMWKSGGKDWKRTLRTDGEVVAGGFVRGGVCYGESISCKVKSRGEEDARVLGLA